MPVSTVTNKLFYRPAKLDMSRVFNVFWTTMLLRSQLGKKQSILICFKLELATDVNFNNNQL